MKELILSSGEKVVYELPWTPIQYGIAAMVVFSALAIAITRMNKDR
ncbi:MAG: hypothetical protein O2902_02870 [Actinobacteria bacterium]|nr:hypothetical protein [Actinomycetota bacterium]MDA2975420.1 hypothetical protein [Actinomycetota bacterium]